MTEADIIQLDIDKVLNARNQKLYKMLPKFVINYLKRIIHQEQMNDFLRRAGTKQGLEFIEFVIEDFKLNPQIIGLDNVPKNQRFIFAANHPLGGFDGLMFIYFVGKYFGTPKAVINDLLLNIKNLQPVFIGVNLFGSNSHEAVTLLDKTFESDAQILFFPAGLVSRKVNGIITDLEWKKTFINRATRHKLDIIPVHVGGRNSNFFYNLANIRRKLHVKMNIEMVFLPDEMYKNSGSTIPVTFGKPIPYQTFDKRFPAHTWAEMVKKHVYAIENQPDKSFELRVLS